MAMRLTDKQREKAAQVGRSSFDSLVALNFQIPEAYPLEDANTHVKRCGHPDWEDHFNRTDITGEQKQILNDICFNAYQEAYVEHVSYLYTPKTLEQYTDDKQDAEMFKDFVKLLANSENEDDVNDADIENAFPFLKNL